MSEPSLAESLRIVHYPHPTLRHKSKVVKKVDAELVRAVARMFELMYEHKGIGLAANQVDLPYRLFIINLKGAKGEGEELVFINPVLSKRKGLAEAEEGCLSLPGLYAQVKRPEKVTVQAYTLQGQLVQFEADGLFARAIQHEVDHLDGVLFIDRLNTTGEMEVRDTVHEFEINFDSRRRLGEIPDDDAIAARLKALEAART